MGNIENKLKVEDSAIHDWYRFVLSFPPHLVQQYLDEFGACNSSLVLDPFCGIEASPITYFASKTKCSWVTDTYEFITTADQIAQSANKTIREPKVLRTLSEEQSALI